MYIGYIEAVRIQRAQLLFHLRTTHLPRFILHSPFYHFLNGILERFYVVLHEFVSVRWMTRPIRRKLYSTYHVVRNSRFLEEWVVFSMHDNSDLVNVNESIKKTACSIHNLRRYSMHFARCPVMQYLRLNVKELSALLEKVT